ncbi:MAG TPA: hypothetical protein VIP05_25400 [Burkholderiaceae bacterium]
MRATARAVLAVATLAAAAAAGADPATADKPDAASVIDPDELVLDRPQSEWSQAYLQWVAAFPRGSSPVSDTTGALCAAKQDGDVWFLASSDGTAPVVRDCAIPAGKTLFVPVAGVLERSGSREPDCAAMARVAADNLHHASALSMTIDGRAVDDLAGHRLAGGGCFALGLRLVPRQTTKAAVADGWYVMLRPLPAGAHTLVVQARFDSTPVSTTYRLDVH